MRSAIALVYALPASMREEMGDARVSIDPSEITAAWVYDLNWDPLPVIQNYTAYTTRLDELNAAAIASGDGPEMVLRAVPRGPTGQPVPGTIDGRFIGWDPPAQAVATLCNFETAQAAPRWLLLERVPNRCGEPREIGSVDAAYGETIDVPAPGPGEVVFVRIHGAEVGGLEAIRALLYKAVERRAVVNGTRNYRLIPGTAADGLLLRGSPRLVGAGPFAQAPQAETLELTGPSGELRYDFYAMSVETSGGERPGKGD